MASAHCQEDGVGVSAQRSGGWGVARVVAAGALLALVVAVGASWEDRGASTQRPARKEALWEGALSKSLAKHIVRQQAVVAPQHTVQAYSRAAAPAVVGSKHASAARAAHPHQQTGSAPTEENADTPADQLAKLAALKAEGILDEASYRKARAKVVAEDHPAKPALAPKAKLFDAFATAGASSKASATATAPGSQKLALSPAPKRKPALSSTHQHKASKTPLTRSTAVGEGTVQAAPVAKAEKPKKGSQEWEREQDALFFDSLGKSHTGAENLAIRRMRERLAHEKEERQRYELNEAHKELRKDTEVREEIAHNEATEVRASLADNALKDGSVESKHGKSSTAKDARTPSLVAFWDKQMKTVEHQHHAAKVTQHAPVQFWDKKMKEEAKQHLAAKAKAAARTDVPVGHKVATHLTVHKMGTHPIGAHGPTRGSPEWEREQDAKFFDSLGKSHTGAEEKAIRKIKDRDERRSAEHALKEREEEEKVHEGDMKAREEQRNAELAAKKYTKSAFQDMDKHLSNINSDSVTGFKTMEAKELASEVERDHPNESSQQIAARAMKLLGLVMKSRHGDPQVSSASTDNVSPMGPMGVAPQVGGV